MTAVRNIETINSLGNSHFSRICRTRVYICCGINCAGALILASASNARESGCIARMKFGNGESSDVCFIANCCARDCGESCLNFEVSINGSYASVDTVSQRKLSFMNNREARDCDTLDFTSKVKRLFD